jgi:hypothetical protein
MRLTIGEKEEEMTSFVLMTSYWLHLIQINSSGINKQTPLPNV